MKETLLGPTRHLAAILKQFLGKLFLALLQKHFPWHHKYYKLFNKNNVKINYNCMPNMKSFIQNRNANLISTTLLQHAHAVADKNQNVH